MKPFKFIDPNQCPDCLGLLKYKEIEIYEAPLDEHGVPDTSNGISYAEPRLVCDKCGKIWDCERKGLAFQINHHLPKVKPIYKNNNPFYKS